MKKLFSVPQYSTFADFALLLIRVTAGLALAFHGWPKFQSPFNWMGPQGFAPAPFQALAALAEFGGGIALIFGMVTALAALGVFCTMLVAVSTHVLVQGDPFVSATGGPAWELAAVYLCIAVVLIALGPGRFSIDRQLFRAR